MLQQMTGVTARLVDLAELTLADQIHLISAQTDLLIGTPHC